MIPVRINKRVPKKEKPKPGGPVRAIRRDALRLMLESAKEAMPNEFAGILRAYDGVITEVMVLPGTEQGARAALFGRKISNCGLVRFRQVLVKPVLNKPLI